MADGFAIGARTIKVKAGDNSLEIVLEVADASAVVTVTDASGYLTEAVSGALKTSTPLRDIPQSISVVSSELIRDQSMQSMADVIAYVPGITSHQGEN
ncbi:MAG: TonB-dependent siderophore receptor, partial [Acidobacteria bacterium]